MMSRFLLGILCVFYVFDLQSVTLSQQERIQTIDAQIRELEEEKKGYEGRALRHEDYAQRQQFQDRVFLESRRHIQLADENRQKAQAVQQEIDELQKEKQTILNSEK